VRQVRQSSNDIYTNILTSSSHIRQKSIKADEDDFFYDTVIDIYDDALEEKPPKGTCERVTYTIASLTVVKAKLRPSLGSSTSSATFQAKMVPSSRSPISLKRTSTNSSSRFAKTYRRALCEDTRDDMCGI
jgi:hypothetical protein